MRKERKEGKEKGKKGGRNQWIKRKNRHYLIEAVKDGRGKEEYKSEYGKKELV